MKKLMFLAIVSALLATACFPFDDNTDDDAAYQAMQAAQQKAAEIAQSFACMWTGDCK